MLLTGPDARPDQTEARLTRRGLGKLLGAAGFAAALSPPAASAIQTPSVGLVTGSLPFKSGEDTLPAYVARPEGPGPFPVVLVVHEIFGIHEYIRDVTRRFAQKGYMAVAPDLFARAGDPSGLEDWDKIREIVATATHDQVMGDLSRLIDFLETQPEADTARLGLTGFYWGGKVAWMFAAEDPRLKASVAWYGRLRPRDEDDDAPYPLQVAGDLKAPVLGLYGSEDRGIPVSDVEMMQTALAETDATSRIILYQGAQHGFHADYRDSYDKTSAEDGWARALAWFQTHGVEI